MRKLLRRRCLTVTNNRYVFDLISGAATAAYCYTTAAKRRKRFFLRFDKKKKKKKKNVERIQKLTRLPGKVRTKKLCKHLSITSAWDTRHITGSYTLMRFKIKSSEHSNAIGRSARVGPISQRKPNNWRAREEKEKIKLLRAAVCV